MTWLDAKLRAYSYISVCREGFTYGSSKTRVPNVHKYYQQVFIIYSSVYLDLEEAEDSENSTKSINSAPKVPASRIYRGELHMHLEISRNKT